MDIRGVIRKTVGSSLEKLSFGVGKISLEHPNDTAHGDYSTNAAMVLAKESGCNSRELAEQLVREMESDLPEEIEKVEVAGPGFINFHLSGDFFHHSIQDILSVGKGYGQSEVLKGQKVIIEHSQPNPFKEFHIGHLVNNIIGESISRITEAHGAEVKKVSYHGDVGLHVAKTVWAITKNDMDFNSVSDLGVAYALGDTSYNSDPEAKKEITEINKKIYEGDDKKIQKIYEKGRKLSIDHFDEIYSRLGSEFDHHFFESEAAPVGKDIVLNNVGEVFKESEGAIIFPEERSGLHTRVFINSEGFPTYEAKDLGLITLKKEYFPSDLSVYLVDVEQSEYFKVVFKAAESVFPDLSGKLLNIPHGRLRLSTGRMSSRTGNIISGEDVLNKVRNLALERMKERNIEDKEGVADKIAISAIKYSVLKQAAGKNIVFDEEKSLSFEGDSGPYLQYSLVRAYSILKKAKEEGISENAEDYSGESGELEKELYQFPETTERSWQEHSPHYIANYLIELSSTFNSFYSKEKIVDKSDENSGYKISLTRAFSIVMENGLDILGIPKIEEM